MKKLAERVVAERYRKFDPDLMKNVATLALEMAFAYAYAQSLLKRIRRPHFHGLAVDLGTNQPNRYPDDIRCFVSNATWWIANREPVFAGRLSSGLTVISDLSHRVSGFEPELQSLRQQIERAL